jgi:hypothetical protein
MTAAEGTNQSPGSMGNDDTYDMSQWPRADSSSRYHAALKALADSYPLATEALMRADRHRLRRLQQFVDPVDLEAVNSLFGYLISVSRSLGETRENHDLIFLPDRVMGDVRIALEGLMSGYLQTVSDAMRDIIETELLIRDFALDATQINKWRNTSKDMLWKNFQPSLLRKRQAAALGVNARDVPGATDYSAHSELLHVGKTRLFPRTPESGAMAGHRVTDVLNSLADIMHHASSAVRALDLFLDAIGCRGPDSGESLAALSSASGDLSRARSAVEAIERIAADRLSQDGNLTTVLFESGLVLAFDHDAGRLSFYRTNRIDFRSFHRSVTKDGSASFSLIPLGEGEATEDDSDE